MHTVLPRTNHLPASPLFEIKQFNLTVFSSFFFFVNSSHALILLTVTHSVANLATLSLDLATFQTPLATVFFFKRLATNLATFGKNLATFQMWPVLSCEREILSYTSPCVCSDQ